MQIIDSTTQYSQVSDKLDQQQARAISPHSVVWPNKLAQSFKPKSDHLTRIHLSISKVQNPSDIIVSIRKELDGDDLTSVIVQSKYLLMYPNKALFDCNIPDITVVPEQTYYIIFQHEAENTQDDMLYWWYDQNSTYTRGTAWQWTVENGSIWTDLNYDFCFKIFSYNSQNNNINNSTDIPTDDSKKTPGFELFFVIGAIALILLCKRRKKL